jgi:release factor glutamine methyltransferase
MTRTSADGPRDATPPGHEDLVATLRAAGCVYAEEEADLLAAEAASPEELAALVRRRSDGEPLEHVLGWVRFGGLRLVVRPGVFVPRRRTELLAREAARACRPGRVLVELCCGCAPIAAAVAASVPRLTVAAADIDPAAVTCAVQNLPADAETFCGDLFDPLPARFRQRIDVLVANAPYVPHGALGLMPREARLHESLLALDGGGDGLDVHRRIVAESGAWLAPRGLLLIEVADEQLPTAAALFRTHGYRPTVVGDPDLGATVIVAKRT